MIPRSHSVAAFAALALAALALAAGCGRRAEHAAAREPMGLPVRVTSDTGRSSTLDVRPPPVAIWVAKVSPTPPRSLDVPLPSAPAAEPALPEELPAPPALAVDPGLKAPILRTPAALELPAARRAEAASVELDVRVDEGGAVSDALWAGGSGDSLLVRAAIESALGMKFYPALQAGRPIAVWCRQRFDFASR